MKRSTILPLLLTPLFLFVGCDSKPHSHEGESGHADHGAGGHTAEEGPEPVSVTHFTDKALLFMEFPRLVKGEKARFLAHFSVLSDGEPVKSGSVTLDATGPSGEKVRILAEAPARDGLFTPEGAFQTVGKWKAKVHVKSPQVDQVFELEDLVVYDGKASAEAAAACLRKH